MKQSIIYFCGLLSMKLCVLGLFAIMPWLSRVGDWALRWTEGDERVQVAFVMLIFPVIMNALQYYIIDGFIKDPAHGAHHEALPTEDEDDISEFGGSIESFTSTVEDDAAAAKVDGKDIHSRTGKRKPSLGLRQGSYDPTMDGEDSPTVVGSGSGSGSLPDGKLGER
jgi:STIMATE family